MKKVFTLILAMSIIVTGFAQFKSARPTTKPAKAQQVVLTGFEERDYANFPAPSSRNIMTNPEDVELSQTYYDWQF